ncbi:MAG TPA: DNA alkylation repair protein [Chitinophagaceae bacterium]|nr:DNA alkylation repair protein [Chitinophagaceae bacterium]
MHSYTTGLVVLFKKNANSVQASGAKAYMRNQFNFFGLKANLWRQLHNEYADRNMPDFREAELIIKELWSLPERELQLAAIELLGKYKKQWTKKVIKLIEYLITHKSWWDTVDHIASVLTGPYFKLFPQQIEPITGKWNHSDNFWLQRSSIMFQKHYKKTTDTELLGKYIFHLHNSKEFFIQKAIGWALREYSKTNAQWVRKFVKQNKLAPLSKREALKRLN